MINIKSKFWRKFWLIIAIANLVLAVFCLPHELYQLKFWDVLFDISICIVSIAMIKDLKRTRS
jgi:hypothetical protein